MRKKLKKYFIPHEENDHKPHFLREANVAVLTVIIAGLFFVSIFHASLLIGNKNFLAAILPSVLVDLTNEEREDSGYGNLRINPILEAAARLKAQDMAEKGYFAHDTPDGKNPWYWFYLAGYQFSHAGENLAVNFSDSDKVVNAWMESPGHRANILNGSFTEIGIASAEGRYNGKDTIFVVQLFGKPLASVQGASVEASPSEPELSVETEGPIPEESQDGGEEVARSDVQEIQEIEVTDIVESNDSLYIAVRDKSVAEQENIAVEEPVAEDDEELAVSPVSTTTEDEDEPLEISTTTAIGATESGGETYSTLWQRMFASPHQVLKVAYVLLGLLIIVSIILSLFIEIQKQHKTGIAYGILLLVLITGLTILNKAIIFSDLIIAGSIR